MDRDEFRLRGKEMIDYICEYIGTIEERRVTPSVEPGYLRPLLPPSAPLEPEPWDAIMADVEKYIMPGVGNLLRLWANETWFKPLSGLVMFVFKL